jgi:uncharacterized membrane protein
MYKNRVSMNRLRLVGWFLFFVGLVLLAILFGEEVFNNLNYYYHHQVNFILLLLIGFLSLFIGSRLVFWKVEPKE